MTWRTWRPWNSSWSSLMNWLVSRLPWRPSSDQEALTLALALVKMGGEGVLVATREDRDVVAPHPVEVVCGLGAGDAFGAALVHGLLAGWDPVTIARHANAAGAIVASRLACADAMPTLDELSSLVATEGGAA